MEQTETPIPIFLNEPDKILFWTWGEVGWFLGIFFFVWILCSFVLGVLLGVGTIKLFRLLEKSAFGDLTKIGVYWFLPTYKSFKSLPPSYVRELIG